MYLLDGIVRHFSQCNADMERMQLLFAETIQQSSIAVIFIAAVNECGLDVDVARNTRFKLLGDEI